MKTRKHKRLDALLLGLFLIAVGGIGYAVYSLVGGSSEGPVEAAVLDEAELVLYMNFRELENSDFTRSMNAGQAEEFEAMPPELIAFRDALGIRQEDIVEALVSVSGLNALQAGRFDTANIAGAIRVDAPLTLERIESAINSVVPAGERESIGRREVEGRPALTFPVPDLGITFALAVFERDENASTLYFGTEASLRSTLAKLGTRRETQLPGTIRDGRRALMSDSQAWIVVSVPSQVRTQIREGLAASPFQLGPAGDALATLRQAGIALRGTQSLDVQLLLRLGSAENARNVQSALNEMLLPIVQMTAQMQMDSAPSFLGQLRADATDTNVILSFSVSASEIERLIEAAPQQFPPMGGGPAITGGPPRETSRDSSSSTAVPEIDPWPALSLEATNPERREAIINGTVVPEGGQIQGVTVYEVESRGAILRLDREYRFINVGNSVGEID